MDQHPTGNIITNADPDPDLMLLVGVVDLVRVYVATPWQDCR